MFSDNQKISGRQACRFFVLASLGSGGLVIPGILAETAGGAGGYGILLNGLILVFYLIFTAKIDEMERRREKKEGFACIFVKMVANCAFMAVFAVMGSFLLLEQSSLVQKMLLPGVPVFVTSGIFLAVCAYGAFYGIEDLARISEVIFWLVVVLLVVLFLLTKGNVPLSAAASESFDGSFRMALAGAAETLPFMSAYLLLPFHYGELVNRGRGRAGMLRAIVVSCGFFCVLFVFCTGVFGMNYMGSRIRPLVELMQGVSLPGGLFGKVDAFFSIIFILGLFFSISQILLLWKSTLKSMVFTVSLRSGMKNDSCVKMEKWFLISGIAVIYAGSIILGNYQHAESFYRKYMQCFGLGLFAVWPLCRALWLLFRGKRATIKAVAVFLCLSVCSVALNGCSPAPEQREYVLALGMEAGEKGWKLTYAFPDLSKVSDQGGSMENRTIYVAEAESLFRAKQLYAEGTDKEPDYNHLKAVLIEEKLTEAEDFWREFISLSIDGTISRDVRIFLCEDKPETILEAAASESGSAGLYLEALCKNARKLKEKKVFSVGDLCFFATETSGEMVRAKAENLVLPVLAVANDRPTISRLIKDFY